MNVKKMFSAWVGAYQAFRQLCEDLWLAWLVGQGALRPLEAPRTETVFLNRAR